MTEPESPAPRDTLSIQILDKMSALITAAFGFVAALAWNEAIKGLIQLYLPAGSALRGQLLYAAIVTVLAVVAGLWIASATTRARRRLARRQPLPPGGSPET